MRATNTGVDAEITTSVKAAAWSNQYVTQLENARDGYIPLAVLTNSILKVRAKTSSTR